MVWSLSLGHRGPATCLSQRFQSFTGVPLHKVLYLSWILGLKPSTLLVPVYVSQPIHPLFMSDLGQLLYLSGSQTAVYVGGVVGARSHGHRGFKKTMKSVTGQKLHSDKLESQEKPL